MYAAGYVDEQTMMAGLGKRGADVGALLDDTVGMGVANSINLTDDEIDAVCREAWSADGTELVFPSNFNRYNQVIFGGHKKAIERLLKILEERKAVKSGSDVFMLDSVKTPFHTPLLREASERMRAFFKATPVFYPRRPNVSRVLMDTTGAYLPEDTGAIQEIFADQISNPTKLREVIRMAILAGVRRFVEIGIRENLAKHVFSVAKSLGFTDPEAEFEILFVNPEVNPEDYSRFTYDFVESPLPKAAPVPVVAEKPKEEAAAPVAMSMMMPQMGVAAPSWKEVTSAEFRQAYTQLGIRAIGHKVNKDDVTQAGDQALYKLVTQQAKKITVIGDAAFESLVEQFTADMVALEPGALGFLRDQNAYLAGVLGLEGGDLNKRSLWADWSEGDLIAYCKAMWEANAAVGEFTIN
ncbi:MAG TPA: hypothetical protein DDW49_01470, partial [Deltaproteobacteria bacterium]|nr:hypothetical protein [Deltaproteobacteria bacterium]